MILENHWLPVSRVRLPISVSRLSMNIEYSIKDRQFGSIVAKVKADDPDAIYASGYYFTAGPLVSQLRAAGVTVPVIGQEGYDSQKFIEIAGPSSEGIIITTSLDRDSNVPETRNFISAFEKKAGFKVDMVAASAHTAIMVAADALKRAGSSEPEALRKAIAATNLKRIDRYHLLQRNWAR